MCFHVWLIIIKVDFKNHMKTHSYTEATFNCQNCYFVGNCSETMDVHMGLNHTDNFECGLCESKFGNKRLGNTPQNL